VIDDLNRLFPLWDKYLEGKLSDTNKKMFEKKLSKKADLFNFLMQLKKDILLLGSPFYKSVPKSLLGRALGGLDKEYLLDGWGKIILRIIDKGFQIVEDTFSQDLPKTELLAYRDIKNNREKLVFNQNEFKIVFLQLSKAKVNIEVIFDNDSMGSDNVVIYLKAISEDRMIASLKPVKNKVIFKSLPIAEYSISILKKKLSLNLEIALQG
jgi:hypothetical protein